MPHETFTLPNGVRPDHSVSGWLYAPPVGTVIDVLNAESVHADDPSVIVKSRTVPEMVVSGAVGT